MYVAYSNYLFQQAIRMPRTGFIFWDSFSIAVISQIESWGCVESRRWAKASTQTQNLMAQY